MVYELLFVGCERVRYEQELSGTTVFSGDWAGTYFVHVMMTCAWARVT